MKQLLMAITLLLLWVFLYDYAESKELVKEMRAARGYDPRHDLPCRGLAKQRHSQANRHLAQGQDDSGAQARGSRLDQRVPKGVEQGRPKDSQQDRQAHGGRPLRNCHRRRRIGHSKRHINKTTFTRLEKAGDDKKDIGKCGWKIK